MTITCNHCKLKQDLLTADVRKIYLSNGGYHLVAYCSSCQKFIKNIPHSEPQVLHFGKHKGKPLAVIANEDESYLRWLVAQDIKQSLKGAILKILEKKECRQKMQTF